MTHSNSPTDSDEFVALRPRLFSIAYRMLGTRVDSEDVLQDAWLVTVVTRLAIDRLRAAKADRESYVGWWLPEPLVELDERTPEAVIELAGEVSVAFMWVLERLSPEERAAFLLRKVFDYDYKEIATLLAKNEANCRQMVHRASERIQLEYPRFDVSPDTHRHLLEKFMQAARNGEREAIKALLADEVKVIGDGGGKAPSFMEILRGTDRIADLYRGVSQKFAGQVVYRIALINGEPGLLRYISGQLESAQAFVTDGEYIVAIYAVRNPDKLASIPRLQ